VIQEECAWGSVGRSTAGPIQNKWTLWVNARKILLQKSCIKVWRRIQLEWVEVVSDSRGRHSKGDAGRSTADNEFVQKDGSRKWNRRWYTNEQKTLTKDRKFDWIRIRRDCISKAERVFWRRSRDLARRPRIQQRCKCLELQFRHEEIPAKIRESSGKHDS